MTQAELESAKRAIREKFDALKHKEGAWVKREQDFLKQMAKVVMALEAKDKTAAVERETLLRKAEVGECALDLIRECAAKKQPPGFPFFYKQQPVKLKAILTLTMANLNPDNYPL